MIFVCKQDEILPLYYQRARVFVLPTTVESFGQVYLEALSCGTPCVGFGNNKKFHTATSEILEQQCGVIIEHETEEQLAKGINSILDLSETDYIEMSKNCRKLVIDNYSWYKFTNELLSQLL